MGFTAIRILWTLFPTLTVYASSGCESMSRDSYGYTDENNQTRLSSKKSNLEKLQSNTMLYAPSISTNFEFRVVFLPLKIYENDKHVPFKAEFCILSKIIKTSDIGFQQAILVSNKIRKISKMVVKFVSTAKNISKYQKW